MRHDRETGDLRGSIGPFNCAVRQAWPLRPKESIGQLTQGTDK